MQYGVHAPTRPFSRRNTTTTRGDIASSLRMHAARQQWVAGPAWLVCSVARTRYQKDQCQKDHCQHKVTIFFLRTQYQKDMSP